MSIQPDSTVSEPVMEVPEPPAIQHYTLYGVNSPRGVNHSCVDAVSHKCTPAESKPVVLDHHIFDSDTGWKKCESMSHPSLRLRLRTDEKDYSDLGVIRPRISPSSITAVTDTGAQSCLWGLNDFYRCGFTDSDLLPVTRTMVAANRNQIDIRGAVFVRLSGVDSVGRTHTAPVMVYVSPDTEKFYLSREALVQLGVISKDFPQVGSASASAVLDTTPSTCKCLPRAKPPTRPSRLPFTPSAANIPKMKQWILNRYEASTFNKCKHQPLQSMTGPEITLHIDESAPFKVAHVPSPVSLHHRDEVKKQLDDDVAMGVIEKVPHGEVSRCCHRMVVTRKADGGPRRTVDMSSLNRHTKRETHHVKPPFQQARLIPPNTWKSVTDAWNGYHSVPLRHEDRWLTTFITEWGRYRYCVAPQGCTASGDGYSRRYDEIISEVERKTKCVDDTALWDTDLESHWWRMLDFVELCGNNGVVLNKDKFQFSEREIDFAGFHVSETGVKPLDKYLRSISDFPTPTSTVDIRAWFGLLQHVSHYGQLITYMEPFRRFLKKNAKFEWNIELDELFEKSKVSIVDAIKEGVEIFDIARPTCLRTDYSKVGVGYFLSQKHCSCSASTPGCCTDGWKVTLAGSRFNKPPETRYAPVEGEALAIAWALDQTKFFTLGCDQLVVVTDHKPLVKIFGDTTLDNIDNSRLFSLKQHTLPWKFTVEYKPGKDNAFADAASRFPADGDDYELASVGISDALAVLMTEEEDGETSDIFNHVASLLGSDIRALTWDMVKLETEKDLDMVDLQRLISTSFPDKKQDMPSNIVQYWPLRHNLTTVDGVILMNEQVLVPKRFRDELIQSHIDERSMRIIIPLSLRDEVLRSLHSAHQGVSGMNERAKTSVFWPGITHDIQTTREGCKHCNNIMPSQPRLPPVEPIIPTTPFEAICCDYFHFMGWYYFVAADRLSGWFELHKIKVGTHDAGAQGLCNALRRLMVTFGVPSEISSDGGPEFVAHETRDFLVRWGIRHRLSSVSFAQSNGRAELAVKTAKRLLMDNIKSNGELDTDRMVRAMLTYRNTPDPGCKLSPAEILLGRKLKDTLPMIRKDIMTFNNPQVSDRWRDAWRVKEDALKTRYVRTLETLSEHSRPLSPLRIGDGVMIQNQSGRFPKKWDKSGVIVETKANDQYVVKVAGSGRLTLRNRRFLRRYNNSNEHVPGGLASTPTTIPPTPSAHTVPSPGDSVATRQNHIPNSVPSPNESPSIDRGHDLSLNNEDNSTPLRQVLPTPAPTPLRQVLPTPTRTLFGEVTPEEAAPPVASSPVIFPPPARSSRVRSQRQLYDASTGTYSKPMAVPEDV